MFNQILWGMLSAAPALTPLPGVVPSDFRIDEIPISSPVLAEVRATIVPLPPLPENSCRPATTEWRLRLPGMCSLHRTSRPRGGFRITLEREF